MDPTLGSAPPPAWQDAAWFALLFPLLGAGICGFFSGRLGRAGTVVVACGAVLLAFASSVLVALGAGQGEALAPFQWTWVAAPGFQAAFSALTDGLTGTMLLVVTGVGFLIHAYAAGYMAHERDHGRFFTLLNLFVAAMVTLVLAGSLPMLLVGWGGVGFASYALIGFYFDRPSAVKASRKAFVVNLVGDLGLMLALFAVALTNPGSDLSLAPGNLESAARAAGGTAPVIAALLLVAAYAKSAQLPLHTWLPDAMEGPTPVSALIHAATMVTAGVYLVVRMSPFFEAAPEIQATVALLGGLSALYAATSALTQTDLKRVLAWSTMSQLGYMFMACGVGAYTAAMFHLVTHAFFKALLFLTAGVVIHALHDEQDMRRMGGLRRSMPLAWGFFLVGTLAITGVPLLSGFFSKDEILVALYAAGLHGVGATHHPLPGGLLLWLVGLVTALLTGFYMFRALFLTFHGEPRHQVEPPHAPGTSMVWTVSVLALLAVVGGVVNLPPGWTFGGLLAGALEPLVGGPAEHQAPLWAALALPLLATLLGLGGAWWLVLQAPPPDPARESSLARFLRSGWGIDQAYGQMSGAVHVLAAFLRGPLEDVVARLAPEGLAGSLQETGRFLGLAQTGSIRGYARVLVLGLVVLLLLAMFFVKGGA